MIMNKNEIFTILKQNQVKIRSFGVKRLGVFGSFIHGKQREESDIDVLVEFDKERKSYDNFIHLVFFLEDLLHRDVELVTQQSLSPYIRPQVVSEIEYAI
jgi:uncharacterized protein